MSQPLPWFLGTESLEKSQASTFECQDVTVLGQIKGNQFFKTEKENYR